MSAKQTKLKQTPIFENFQSSNESLSAKSGEKFLKAMWNDNNNLNPVVTNFLSTIEADYQLYPSIIESLKAQFKMHLKRQIIPEHEGKQIIEALDKVHKELADSKIQSKEAGTIYNLIENRISEIAPEAYFWFATGRSQSSQVIGDLKIWIRNSIDSLESSVQNMQSKLIDRAEDSVKTIFPANSHAQLSQPTSFGHHLLAFVEMFGRDRLRLKDARARMNESPYASGEMTGSSFNLNREMVARTLSFDRTCQNSLDAICSTDFIIEFLSHSANLAINISRLTSEMISWHSSSNNYISFNSSFVEQSPILPYKRDQLTLESIRAKTSRVIGHLTSTLVICKDLELEPNRDMIEMFEIITNSFKDLNSSIEVLSIIISTFTINRKVMKEAASKNFSTAQDLADWIVQKTKVNPVQARIKARAIIEYAIEKGKKLSLLELNEIKKIEPQADDNIYSVLIPSRTLIVRRSGNGSNPVQIRKSIRSLKRRYC